MNNKKECSHCKKFKSFICFRKNKAMKKDGLSTQCKSCLSKYDKAKYTNPERIQKYKDNRNIVKLENRSKILSYLSDNPCIDCGENNPIILDFDHVNHNNKKYTISRMLSVKMSWSSIKKEILKCVVRCANCHRIKTSKEQNWYKQLYLNSKPILSKKERIDKGRYSRPPEEGKSSKFKGVSKNKKDKKWWASIRVDGNLIHLGRFTKEIDAAKAYNSAAITHQGKFAYLNSI